MRKLTDPVVWTNVFFLFPAASVLLAGWYLLSATLTVSGVVSFFYHLHGETRYVALDYFFAILNFFLCVSVKFIWMNDNLTNPNVILGFLLGYVSIKCFGYSKVFHEDLYDYYHSLWHVMISLTVFFLFLDI